MNHLPRIIKEHRTENGAVIWYQSREDPARSNSTDKPPSLAPKPTQLTVGLVVPSWGKPCGVAEYTAHLARSLRGNGHKPVLLPCTKDGFVRALDDNRPNVVHLQHEYAIWEAGSLIRTAEHAARSRVKVVATVHAVIEGHGLNRLFANPALNGIIVHSKDMASPLIYEGVPESRVHVLAMAVPSFNLPDRDLIRKHLGINDGLAIGFFGFCLPHKGIIELLEAVAILRGQLYDLKLFAFASVTHDPASRQLYRAAQLVCEQRGLKGLVHWETAYRPEPEVVRYLHAMDLIVLPYRDISVRQVSAAVRTAMAARRPVITTTVFPFSDLSGEVYRIPQASPDEIARAVLELRGNPAERTRLVRSVEAYAMQNSWTKVADRHISLYASLR